MSDSKAHFQTRGLRELFGLEEIRIERTEFLLSLEEYATLLSFLFETISAAEDFNLPYGYMEEFQYKGHWYSLTGQNGYRVLARENRP
jgi:hypothetical protein